MPSFFLPRYEKEGRHAREASDDLERTEEGLSGRPLLHVRHVGSAMHHRPSAQHYLQHRTGQGTCNTRTKEIKLAKNVMNTSSRQ